MASTKAECEDLFVNTENKVIDPETQCKNLTADTVSTNTHTDAQVQSLSADAERTSTDIDTQVKKRHAEDANKIDTLDTLTLARVDRENQGSWEAEYSYGGEADLHKHCNNCKKNPGHKNFIPVDKFSIKDLPQEYRDKYFMDYIRAVSDLTVRVAVKYISEWRPATVPGSDKPYPGYSSRGKRRMTVGTGCVSKVNVFNEKDEECTCECESCNNSSTPEKHFAVIDIRTATHVVFDDREAEHTTFHLSFDRESRPETCQGVVPLTGGVFGDNDLKGDICDISCFTHDLDLAHRLQKILDQMNHLIHKISFTRYRLGKHKRALNAGDKKPLLFIVSHPHGCSKQISLGHVISARTYNNKVISCNYTTPTCPGSSGAAVFLPELSLESSFNNRQFHVHESHGGSTHGINWCPTNQSTLSPQLVSLNLLKLDEGFWKVHFICFEENGQLKHDTCYKNPGHQNFFPVDKLSISNLPPVYRTDEIFDFIKMVSDLTVRVSVKYVSEERPETVPGTDIPYPWYSHRGSKQLREGNGWINHIVIYDIFSPKSVSKLSETCVCKECRGSLSPQKSFARITIKSAAHLVYDRLEAEHTTCELVIDSRVVTLTDVCKTDYSIDDDTCLLTYTSHDIDLAYSVNNLIDNYIWRYSFDVEHYYKFAEVGEQNARMNMKKEPPLFVTVSHPHGSVKQISIGYCSNHDSTKTDDIQIPYALIICPGSSGAPLVTLGWDTLYPEIV